MKRCTFVKSTGASDLNAVVPWENLYAQTCGSTGFLKKKSSDSIRATFSSSRAKSWNACKSAAEKALSKSVPEFRTYHRIEDPGTKRLEHGQYFQYFRGYVEGALMDLPLVFLMTEEDNYARAAKRILLEITFWPTADDDVTSVSARWGDEAGLSFSKYAHVAYGWLYPALNDKERKQVFDIGFALCAAPRVGDVECGNVLSMRKNCCDGPHAIIKKKWCEVSHPTWRSS